MDDPAIQAGMAGFVLGLSSVFLMGPQNICLIRAGIARSHVLTVATTGLSCESGLLLVALLFAEAAMAAAPAMAAALQLLGVGFLLACAFKAFSGRVRYAVGSAAVAATETRASAASAMVAVTVLNPLVYLRLLMFVGLMASQTGIGRLALAGGFLSASAVRFFGWALVGRSASPWLSGPARQAQFDALAGSLLVAAAAMLAFEVARGSAG